MLPSLAIIIGGSASGNVLASVGVSRELKLLIGYELPFICALLVPIIKSGVFSVSGILEWQSAHGPVIASFSGVLAFVAALFAIQGKLGYVPFDVAEAEAEIGAGALIEYSGILLGMYKLAKTMLLVVGPLFIAALYLGGIQPGPLGIVAGILKYVLVLVLIILIKNTNPRLRIDQTLRFFWGGLAVAGVLAVLAAGAGY